MKAFEILEVTKTKNASGIKWYADANDECWWSENMDFCISKHHSSKWALCDGNMNRIDWASSFKEAANLTKEI